MEKLMGSEDFEEIEVSDFKKSVQLAIANGYETAWLGCYLCNPVTFEELKILNIEENKITFEQSVGNSRSVPVNVLSKWTTLVPSDHILNMSQHKPPNPHDEIRPLIEHLRVSGVPANYEQSHEDLLLIKNCLESDLEQTDPELRLRLYSTVKKLENFPSYQQDSFKIGRKILENWGSSSIQNLPADILIHLSYYRRWSKDIEAALQATDCLEGQHYNRNISDRERSILATERAAAYLDLYEKNGRGMGEALRFLKYSHAANSGNSSPENVMCWKRHDRLAKRD